MVMPGSSRIAGASSAGTSGSACSLAPGMAAIGTCTPDRNLRARKVTPTPTPKPNTAFNSGVHSVS